MLPQRGWLCKCHVYSSTCEVYAYAEAMLLLVFNSYVGAQCIVGVGVAERSHLLQGNSYVLSLERTSEGDGRRRRNKTTKKCILHLEEQFVDEKIMQQIDLKLRKQTFKFQEQYNNSAPRLQG